MKKFLTLTICLTLILFISGCGREEEQNNNNINSNQVVILNDEETIAKLKERLNTLGGGVGFSYRSATNMLKEENGVFYFTDHYMIAQGIDLANANWDEDISFTIVDNHIRSFFNVDTYEYENANISCSDYLGYRFNRNRYIYEACMRFPTGGFWFDFFPELTIEPVRFEQTNDYYIVHAKALSKIQNAEEYFCAGTGTDRLSLKIFDDFNFDTPKFKQILNINCTKYNDIDNRDNFLQEIKEEINFNELVENAPTFKFFFTRNNLLIDRIEKIR